jgi:hypothetical protein
MNTDKNTTTTTTTSSSTTSSTSTGRKLMAAATITMAFGAFALGGSSAAHAQSTDDPALSARLERACLRIPNLQTRTDNLLVRINGDASTRGSLLWLDTKIAEARAANRNQLADALTNRRAVRAATIPVLELRQASLADLAQRCADHGVGG